MAGKTKRVGEYVVRNARGIDESVAPVLQTKDREWRDGDPIAPGEISEAAWSAFERAGLIVEVE